MHCIYISQTERSLQERVKKYKRDIFNTCLKQRRLVVHEKEKVKGGAQCSMR